MSMPLLTGSCLCGKVRYSITLEPTDFYFCHCQQCRKITGSAFAANILLKPVPIDWVSGFEWVKRFDCPGERIFTKVFCIHCGSGLPFLNKKGDSLVIPAGSLDHPPDIKPNGNIFWADKALWYESGVAAVKCSGFQNE